jgi:hypothetical protein
MVRDGFWRERERERKRDIFRRDPAKIRSREGRSAGERSGVISSNRRWTMQELMYLNFYKENLIDVKLIH